MPENAILEVRDLSCSIGGRAILRDISLDVAAGETIVLLGRSGSGKTTLLKTVNGLIEPTGGAAIESGPTPRRDALQSECRRRWAQSARSPS